MATIDDIDTNAAVRKFLERKVVLPKATEGEDSADEIEAALESTAITFLLNPKAALSLILLAKNTLQQVASKDLELVDFMSAAIDEVSNPTTDVEDTSDLIEAQTALVEIDRVGTVVADGKSFNSYKAAIDRFLNEQLATSLKRNGKNEFERSGQEAKEDLFSALNLFKSTHTVLIDYVTTISKSVDDFRGVDLTRIVSTKTVARVRSSLRKVQQGMEQSSISKTTAAIELLSGSAALTSISQKKDLYDPDVQTGSFPVGRTITFSSVPSKAFITSSVGPFTIANPWKISLAIDGGSQVVTTLPKTGHTGEAYVVNSRASAGPLYSLPGGAKKLYVFFVGSPQQYVEVDLTSLGTSVSFSTISAAINAVLSTGSPNFLGSCSELAPGSNRFLITASTTFGATKVTILENGKGSIVSGAFVPSAPSVHTNLGFAANQTSEPINFITADELADLIQAYYSGVTTSVVDGRVRIESNNDTIQSSLSIDPANTSAFGFTDGLTISFPSAIVLKENGQIIDPSIVGVAVGSIVSASDQINTTNSLFDPVVSVDGNNILFDSSVEVPRNTDAAVTITSLPVFSVQKLISGLAPFIESFADDIITLQRVLSPILSRPTLSQIGDAKRALSELRSRLSNDSNTGLLDLLSSIVVREDQDTSSGIASTILSGLEERGLDRATDLLKRGRFSEFFALSKESASKSSRLLKAIEDVGSSDFSTTTVESQIDDNKPVGNVPDGVLEGQQTSGDIDG